MAEIYVKSTAGGAATGADWTNAFLTAAAAAAVDAAGDSIYFSQSHSESTASALALAFAGTLASPTKLIGVSDAAIPPTDVSSTAIIATNGASSITLTGAGIYAKGLNFSSGSGSSAASFTYAVDAGSIQLNDCTITLNNTSATSRVYFGSATASANTKVVCNNVGFKLGNVSHNINVLNADAEFNECYLISGTASPTSLFGLSGSAAKIRSTGLDLTNAGTGITLFAASVQSNLDAIFRGTKFPDGWSGSIFSVSPLAPGVRAELHNYSIGTTEHQLLVETYAGSIASELTVVRSGGASDGAAFSWAMVSNANAGYPLNPLVSPELPPVWNTATGASKTVTVEVLHDSTTALTDAEMWLEVMYLGTSGTLLQSVVADCKASIIATAADQTTSMATWTTTGLTNPNKQKLSVAITPQEAGYIQARVFLAKASNTVYVDPKLTVA